MGNFRRDFLLYDDWWISYRKFGSTIDKHDLTNDWAINGTGGPGAGNVTYSADTFPPYVNISTPGAGATDSIELQLTAAGGPGEYIDLTTGRAHYFEIMMRLNDAGSDQSTVEQVDWFVGWAVTDTTVLAGCTDYMGFSKVDEGSDATNRIAFVCGRDGGAAAILRDRHVTATNWTSNNPTGTLATDRAAKVLGWNQWIRLAFSVKPDTSGNQGIVWCRVNDLVEFTTSLPNVAGSPVVPDTQLCLTLCIQNGEAQAKTMDIAYVFEAISYGGI